METECHPNNDGRLAEPTAPRGFVEAAQMASDAMLRHERSNIRLRLVVGNCSANPVTGYRPDRSCVHTALISAPGAFLAINRHHQATRALQPKPLLPRAASDGRVQLLIVSSIQMGGLQHQKQ
jgi:hypothetical protein